MSIATTCSHCGATYNLNDQMRGKTVRCKNCQETFVVGAKANSSSSRDVTGIKTKPAGPASSRRVATDKGNGPPTTKAVKNGSAPKKSSTGKWILLGGGGAFLLLLVCCGAPAGVFFYVYYGAVNAVQHEIDQQKNGVLNQDQAKAIDDAFDKAMKNLPPDKGGNPNPGLPPDKGSNPKPGSGGKPVAVDIFGNPKINSAEDALDLLKDKDTNKQQAAVNWLVNNKPDDAHQAEVARALDPLLSDSNGALRLTAARALARWGTKDNVPSLVALLEKRADNGIPGEDQKWAMEALGHLPDERGAAAVVPYLANAFANENAVNSLAAMGREAAEKEVLKAYHHPDGGAQDRARRLLRKFGTQPSAIALQSVTDLKAPEVDRRRRAADWLSTANPDESIRAEVAKGLEGALSDSDQQVRLSSLKALGAWGTDDSVPVLIKLVEDNDMTPDGQAVRHQAMDVLARRKDERAIAPIAARLTVPGDRQHAGQALQTFGPAAEKVVAKYVDNEDRDVRGEAARILKMMGSKENVGVAQALADLKSNEAGRRRDGAATLSRLKVDEGRQAEVAKALEGLLKDSDNGVREEAAKALVVWATEDNAAALIAVLNDQSGGIRQAAMKALGRLKEEKAIEPITVRLLDGGDRATASAALQSIGPKAEKAVLTGLGANDKAVVLEVCKILGVIGTKTSVKPLQTLAYNAQARKQRDVALAASSAIQAIGDRKE